MKLKRGIIKNNLASLITTTVLTIAGLGLTGCQSHQPYSKLENQVYNYVNEFSSKIPKEFIREKNIYHSPSLILGDLGAFDNPIVKSGKGKLIYGYPIPETIVAGYADKKEFELYDATNDPNTLNNISFGRIVFKKTKEIDEIIILNKKNIHTIYIKKGDKWRKGVCIGSYYKYDDECQDNIIKKGKILSQKQVQKYINLSNRIKNTYFPKIKKKKPGLKKPKPSFKPELLVVNKD